MNRWGHVTFISAGAGSGKTYRLTEELERALLAGDAAPAGIIGTTFTVKAASELRERVRDRLRASGQADLAERTAESLIGTVHSVCERLLRRFAFELGISPELNVMSIDDGERFFHQALDQTLDLARVRELNAISHRLGLVDRGVPQWQREVKSIADKARENDMDEQSLGAMGERNAETLLRFFGAESPTTPTADLLAAVTVAADMPADGTKATEAYRQKLIEAKTLLARDDCPWRIWMRLAGEEAAKRSRHHSDCVRAAAERYQGHPAFQRDLRDFLCGIYQIAGGAMARFRALKKEHGLIDFADLEQFVLHALDKPSVRERLRAEVDLLLVDEFQDTNPMQLALFLKIAALAKRAVFVGDAKQAIYEFRGCDPALVFATLESLAAGEAAKTILPKSWRAQPPLLHYLNEVFAAAFSPSTSAVGALPRDSVVLEPQRPPSGGPVVSVWNVAGNVERRVRAVGEGVFRLVARGERVADPESGERRPIRYGDIAVLARTNQRVEHIAAALREMRVPMKMTLLGLLATPEVTLAKSCLRRVADQADTLATAEILALADCAEPEDWLPRRLSWLADPEANEDIAWREDDHPILRRLAELRADSPLRSPVEIVARVLNDVDIRRIVAAWGPDDVRAAQRQKNLDAFLNLAVEHEKHAAAHHDPGTLTGFLLWLEHPSSPDLDLQPVVTTGDAVHVLTYHRAKGLEWPLVVCTDFDYEPLPRTWDVRVELTGTFDIEAPLKGREIRYWPNIFDRRRKGAPARGGHRGIGRRPQLPRAVAGGRAASGLRGLDPRPGPLGARAAQEQAQRGRLAAQLPGRLRGSARRLADAAGRCDHSHTRRNAGGRRCRAAAAAVRAALVRETPAARASAQIRSPLGRARRRPGRPSARCWSSASGSMCAATTWRTWAAGCTPWSPPSCSIRSPRRPPSRAPRRSSPAGTPTSASTPPTPWLRPDGFTPSCRSVSRPPQSRWRCRFCTD